MRHIVSRLVVILILFAVCKLAHAQGRTPNLPGVPNQLLGPGLVGQFDSSAAGGEAATITTRFTPATSDQPAILMITAQIAPGKHTYSLTQPKGGPRATKIELDRSTDYRLLAPFRAEPAPNSRVEKGPIWTGLKIEEHQGTVTWYAPIEITAGVDPQKLEIRGAINLEVCEDGGSCEPVEREFVAREEAAGAASGIHVADWPLPVVDDHAQATVASFQFKGSAVKLSGRLVPASVRPGESAELHITATTPPGGHIYAYAERDAAAGTKPVLIAIQSAGGLLPQRPTTDAQPKVDNSEPVFGPMKYHEGDVTWTQRIQVPKDAPAGDYPISGLLGYQMCDYSGGQGVCELPHAVRFAATLNVGPERSKAEAHVRFAPGESYSKVAAAAASLADFYGAVSPQPAGSATAGAQPPEPPVTLAQPPATAETASAVASSSGAYDLSRIELESSAGGSLSYYIAIALVGGLILNLMPCVLPVIGLKVMSFVEQSGKSRSHAFVLNVWFAAGIIAVFLLLGILAATIGLSWGGQFGKTSFNVTIAGVVFAMALSLLGVWEVPIPGFFGSGSVQSAAAKEGPFGAFLKGVVTTVLATPCTAPLMAAAIAWAVTQPIATNLTVFASVGLGMASPYLLVGVYPELLRFLPKPGPWMETFKQISGFVLLLTVVFVLSFIEPAAVVPTVLLLLGIAVACWWVARTPLTAEFGTRMKSWASAAVIVLLFVGGSFGVMYRLAVAPVDQSWQPFSLERLQQVAVDEGKTVIVDFSAEWCFNCKVFEKSVLHTRPVEQAIAKSGAVTMYADFTEYPPEIDRTIKALGANGVPVIAIFPGSSPYEPIVFRGGYRQQDLISALSRASARGGAAPAAASTAVTRELQPASMPAVMR